VAVAEGSIKEWYYRQAGKAWRRRPHQRRGAAHRAACLAVEVGRGETWLDNEEGVSSSPSVWCGVVSRAARAVVYLGQQQRHMTWEWERAEGRGERAEVRGEGRGGEGR
jgi:hypothetical protein